MCFVILTEMSSADKWINSRDLGCNSDVEPICKNLGLIPNTKKKKKKKSRTNKTQEYYEVIKRSKVVIQVPT